MTKKPASRIRWEFDAGKDKLNQRNHGISLGRAKELVPVFEFEADPSENEDRWRVVGTIGDAFNLYLLVYSEPAQNVRRAISLRMLTRHELKRLLKRKGHDHG